MKTILHFFLMTFCSGVIASSAWAVNADDPNLNQNAGGAALVSGAVMPGITTCETTGECTGSFQSGSRSGTDWTRLLPGDGATDPSAPKTGDGIGE